MRSQPGPKGRQLTVGGAGSGPKSFIGTGEGKAFGPEGRVAVSDRVPALSEFAASGPATTAAAGSPEEGSFVEGE